MRGFPMLEEEKALPGPEHGSSADHGDVLVHVGQAHADVRGHVVTAFVSVDKVRRILRDEVVEEGVQVGARGRISVLHDHQRAAG